jgi:hypothetical protein
LSVLLARPCLAADPALAPIDLAGIRVKAEQGQPAFQAYFGYLYLNGQNGLQQNYEEAFKWYHRAADQGYVLAEYNLGVMYDEGIGVTQSHEAGYFWLTLAANATGKPDYMDRRDKAGTTLSLAQTAELKQRIAAWKPVMSAPVKTESASVAAPAKPLTPGVPVPLFRLPPTVQKTINDNVGSGCTIGKIERAVEDGMVVYRAQINKPGALGNIVRVGESGKLISVGNAK